MCSSDVVADIIGTKYYTPIITTLDVLLYRMENSRVYKKNVDYNKDIRKETETKKYNIEKKTEV